MFYLVTKVHFLQKASISKEALPILGGEMLIKIGKLLITYFSKKKMRKLTRVRNGRACQVMNFRYHLANHYSNPHVCLFVFPCIVSIQLLNFAYKRLLNKPYENEVTLTRQNPPLKYYQPLELFTQFKKGSDF